MLNTIKHLDNLDDKDVLLDIFNTIKILVILNESDNDKKRYLKALNHGIKSIINKHKAYLYYDDLLEALNKYYFKVTLVGKMLENDEKPVSTDKLKFVKYYKFNKVILNSSTIYEYIDLYLEQNTIIINKLFKRE